MKYRNINDIKERMERATYGEWKIYKNEDGVCIGTKYDHPQLKSPSPIIAMSVRVEEPKRQIWISEENAEFISNSRSDIEFLLKEIERLHADLEAYQDRYYSEDVRMVATYLLEDSQQRLGIED